MTTGTAPAQGRLDPAPSPADGHRRWSAITPRLRRKPWLPVQIVFWTTFLVAFGSALIREEVYFRVAYYPYGDSALDALLVVRADHFHQLLGNYSRVGFDHPGPAFLYLMAAGETLFYRLLHVVPAAYNGDLLAISVYVSLCLALVSVAIFRATRSIGATAISFGVAFLLAAHDNLFQDSWFPVLYIAAFLLFIVAATCIAAGRTVELPTYAFSGAMLVHGHVSFIMFVGVTTVVVGASWWLCHRRAVRSELRMHRWGLVGSGVILVVFLIPMVLEEILHYPGPWPSYLHYVLHASRTPRTLGQVLRFVGRYWTGAGMPLWLIVLAGVVGIVLVVTERSGPRRRFFLCGYGIVLLESLLTVYYVSSSVGRLTPVSEFIYVGFFYLTVPALLVMLAGSHLWIRAEDVVAGRREGAHVRRAAGASRRWIVPTVVGLAAGCVLAGIAASRPAMGDAGSSLSTYAAIVDAIQASPGRDGRTVGMVQDQSADWAVASGIGVQMQRAGVRWCVDQGGPGWTVLYSSAYLCHGSTPLWVLHVTTKKPPARATMVWSGRLVGNRIMLYSLPGG